MKILISGGSGFIGHALVDHFVKQSHEVWVVGRDKNKLEASFKPPVKCLDWPMLPGMAQQHIPIDVIINLAGENIGSAKWSGRRKKQLIDSRLATTTQMADFCCALEPSPHCFMSAGGVAIYPATDDIHLTAPPIQDELSEMNVESQPTFLGQLARAWEEATLPVQQAGIRVINLRLGAVLGQNGGALKQLLWIYKLGLGGRIGSGRQPFPWIALPDVVRAIDFISRAPTLCGPVNLVAPQIIDQQQFAQALAAVLQRRCFFTTSPKLLKWLMGQMAEELLLTGPKVTPKKLQEIGFKFQYPSIEEALPAVLKV